MHIKKIVLVAILCVFLGTIQLGAEPVMDDRDMQDIVNDSMKKAEEYKKQIRLPEGNPAVQKEAEEAARKHYSEENQKRIQSAMEYIRKDLLPQQGDKGSDKTNAIPSRKTDNCFLGPNERLYVFISASIPKDSLRTYAAALKELRDQRVVMVLRGFIGGIRHIQPTIEFIKELTEYDPKEDYNIEVQIDPNLFRLYQIDRVPCLLYAENLNLRTAEASEGIGENIAGETNAFKIAGSVDFRWAIEQLAKASRSSKLAMITEKLGSRWNEVGEAGNNN